MNHRTNLAIITAIFFGLAQKTEAGNPNSGAAQCTETCADGNGVTKYQICRTSEGTSESLCLPDASIDLDQNDTCGECEPEPTSMPTPMPTLFRAVHCPYCEEGGGGHKVCRNNKREMCWGSESPLPDNVKCGACGEEEPPSQDGGAGGDPHFKTWSGEHYDFHGLCDLVLLENHDFTDDLEMDIHIRTKRMQSWSYISNAVLRIGEDSLEVMGRKEGSRYWLNGLEGNPIEEDNFVLPVGLSGYPIIFRLGLKGQHEYHVDLGNGEVIVIKTWNDLVRADVLGATEEHFGNSRGLMGKFGNGEHLARDNLTILNDPNEFGQEWQVLKREGKLFHNMEGVVAPHRCVIPSATETRRRLSEAEISQQDAEMACAGLENIDKDLCVFDVLATNDLDVALAYY